MTEFLTDCFQGPALIASTLVCCVMAYWLMVSLGALDTHSLDLDLHVDMHSPDLHLDVHGDAPDLHTDVDITGGHSPLSAGMMALKFFNLGDVPLMVWMSFFALSTWAITMLFDRGFAGENTLDGLKVLARSGGISLFIAKLCTQPLKGLFDTPVIRDSHALLGASCIVTTSQATSKHGQASCATEASPLVINVRTEDPQQVALKGETVRIVDFDPAANTFIIQRVQQET